MRRTSDRGQGIGIALVVIGAVFLLLQTTSMNVGAITGYLTVIALGAALIVAALFLGKDRAGLAVPGSVIVTIGVILIAQQWLGRYETWAYAWALLPAAAGIGRVLQGTWTGDEARTQEGWRAVGVGVVLFLVFGAMFEFFLFGTFQNHVFARYVVPILLIAGGGLLLVGRDGVRRRAPE